MSWGVSHRISEHQSWGWALNIQAFWFPTVLSQIPVNQSVVRYRTKHNQVLACGDFLSRNNSCGYLSCDCITDSFPGLYFYWQLFLKIFLYLAHVGVVAWRNLPLCPMGFLVVAQAWLLFFIARISVPWPRGQTPSSLELHGGFLTTGLDHFPGNP